jgi:pilus assembly protein Flp/PilA
MSTQRVHTTSHTTVIVIHSVHQKRREGMRNLSKRFIRETEGQDLIEYALLAALIGLATVAAMTALSGSISTEFGRVGTSITAAS